MDQQQLLGLMALNDAFGAMRGQQGSRAIPALMEMRAREQAAGQERAQSNAMLGALGFPVGDVGPSPVSSDITVGMTPGFNPGAPSPIVVGDLPPLSGMARPPAASPGTPSAGLPPEIIDTARALIAGGDRKGAAEFIKDYRLNAATATPDGPSSPLAKLVADYKSGFITQDQFAQMSAKMMQAGGERISFDENGNPVIERGGAVTRGEPLGKAASNKVENRYVDSVDLHSRLDRVGQVAGIDPVTGRMSEDAARMLTYRGKGEDWLATQAEKLGVEPSEVQRDAIQMRTRFTTSVEQLFNAYRKEITGAAAAVQELQRLQKSFLNVNMSPTEFEAAYSEYRGELRRAMRISAKLRREGIDPSSEEGGDIMDRLYLGGGDDAPQDRFSQLIGQGVSEDEAYARLAAEGYTLD